MYKVCIVGMAFGEHNIQSFNGIYKTWFSFLIRPRTTGIYEYWGDMMHYALYELPWLLYWEKKWWRGKKWQKGEILGAIATIQVKSHGDIGEVSHCVGSEKLFKHWLQLCEFWGIKP